MKIGHTAVRYRHWTIEYRPPPIPVRSHDWQYVHDDYDGPPSPLCGTAASVEDCKAAIDELELELELEQQS